VGNSVANSHKGVDGDALANIDIVRDAEEGADGVFIEMEEEAAFM
jgi:hypothetical protein